MNGIKKQRNVFEIVLSLCIAVALSTCGGSGGSGGGSGGGGGDPVWTAGVFEDASNFINQCQSPRSGVDINGDAFPDQQGSTLYENHWLRSWSNNTYLWYSELPDINPASEADPIDYFDLLTTSEITSSGTPKDNYHFTYDTADWLQLTQSGVSVSYGIDWELTSTYVPRALYIRYIESGSPASAPALNLSRGVQIIEIDGVDVETANTQAGVDTLNEGLFPSVDGDEHTFLVRDVGSNLERLVTIMATEVTADPVPEVGSFATASGDVGYLFFNDHNFISEDELYEAMTQLVGVDDLILDLRYNGGGLLYIASQLSYMIAGFDATDGMTFEEMRFNDKHTQTNPVTGAQLSPTPFYSSISQYSDGYSQGTSLPQLNLNRVFILSTGGTCSASEAIINGLRGIDVEVILIGDTTCGKPYGFYSTDNCGTTYFTIQFDGVNHKDSGGYSDGFSPMNTLGIVGELVTGCSVADDLTVPLFGEDDPLISAALNYRITSSCPTPTNLNKAKSILADSSQDKALLRGLGLKIPMKLNQKIYLDMQKN